MSEACPQHRLLSALTGLLRLLLARLLVLLIRLLTALAAPLVLLAAALALVVVLVHVNVPWYSSRPTDNIDGTIRVPRASLDTIAVMQRTYVPAERAPRGFPCSIASARLYIFWTD